MSGVPGELVADRYVLEHTLGTGGMGEVFEARHAITGKKVALKWLRPELAKDDNVRRRLVREAKIAARVQHPNVVDIYDVGTHGGAVFLVMELLRGQTLRQWMAARGPAPAAELVAILVPVLRGLAAVHAADVVHRDLKPQNIFLCEAEDGTIREGKVLDFGIASDAKSITLNELTAPGQIVGTPAYMAPEQLDGRDVDARTDIYAMGVILYEGLTGRRPFDAKDLPSLVRGIILDPVPPVRSLRPEVPEALSEVVARAMARRPEQRYPDVASLLRALAPFAPDAQTTPISFAPPAPRSRSTLWGWVTGGLALAVLMYVTLGPLLAPTEPPPAPPPEEPALPAAAQAAPTVAELPESPPPSAPEPTVAPVEPAAPAPLEAADEPPRPVVERARSPRTATPEPAAAAQTPTETTPTETTPAEAAPSRRRGNRFSLDRSQF
jgi:serine/threonine-protein kinase